jgi:hypothetical protein
MSVKTKPSMDPFTGIWPTPEMPVWELLQKLRKLTIDEKLLKEYDQLLTTSAHASAYTWRPP